MSSDDTLEGGFGPWRAKINGPNAILLAVLLATLAAVCYMLWTDVRDNRSISHTEHITIQQGIDEMVYVQSLTDEERKKLNLTMPESLMRKRQPQYMRAP